jgi:hypothetical protein
MKYTGYVIARKMYEGDSNKLKPFTYYPNKAGGRPPFLYKTKEQAQRVLMKKKILGSPYFNKKDNAVLKFKKSMYMDRY